MCFLSSLLMMETPAGSKITKTNINFNSNFVTNVLFEQLAYDGNTFLNPITANRIGCKGRFIHQK